MKWIQSWRRGSRRSIAMLLFLSMIIFVCTPVLTGCNQTGDGASAVSGNYLFSIDGDKFDFGEARIIFMTYQCMNESVYQNILGDSFWEREISPDISFGDYIKEYCVLPELVCVKALCMMAEEAQLTVSKEAQEYIEAAANQYYYNLSQEEREYLSVDYDTCYRTFEHYYLAHLAMNYYSAEVDTEISDDAARVALVRQIYVTDITNALSAYQLLTEENADFSSVCTQFDETDNSAATVAVARGTMTEGYEEAVFALKEGEISGIIETDDGYYIVRCEKTYDEDLTRENKAAILRQRIYEAWFDDYEAFMADKKTVLNQTAYDMISFAQTEGVSNGTFFEIYDSYISVHE